jgi:hypothetical protein
MQFTCRVTLRNSKYVHANTRISAVYSSIKYKFFHQTLFLNYTLFSVNLF